VGITTNLSRRLRQHNGAVVGGAKATRIGRPWKIGLTVEGFGRPTTTSSSSRRRKSDRSIETATGATATTGKRSCLQFEYMWKHMSPKQSHGKQARLLKLHHLLCKERWTTKSVEARTIPLTVTIYNSSSNSSGDDNDDDDDSSNYDDDALYQLVTTGSYSRQIEFNTLKGKGRAKDTIRSKGETRTTTTIALLPEYVQVQVVQDNFVDV
jgi:hypothetical protein